MELARLLLGLLVAVALPASVPGVLAGRLRTAAFTGLYAAYAVLPVLNGWAAFGVWSTAVVAGQFDTRVSGASSRPDPGDPSGPERDRATGLLRRFGVVVASVRWTGIILFPVIVAWVAFHGRSYGSAATRILGDDRLSVVLSGLLLAVFVGNELVALSVRRYIPVLADSVGGLNRIVPLGIYVGWIERAVVFAFVVGGPSDAAAVAVAAKALVRLPTLQDEDKGSVLGQYIITGTLTSTLASVIAAVAVRLALGLPAL